MKKQQTVRLGGNSAKDLNPNQQQQQKVVDIDPVEMQFLTLVELTEF